MSKVLFIGNIWPEPTSTAAGWRTGGLISCFQEYGYEVVFAATTTLNDYSKSLNSSGVETYEILINDNSFDSFIQDLNPDIVVYDRYMMEEQFGWRVTDFCPKAITLLDTSDLHFLRTERQESFGNKTKTKHQEVKIRELSSILRCDLSLIISQVEKDLLIELGIEKDLLHYLPFTVEIPEPLNWESFDDRQNFVTIGSFLHAPNIDQIKHLKTNIWPLIREELPQAEMHCYGAYCKEKHHQLSEPNTGFFIKGFTKNALDVISSAKVLLAPIRFGAGLKGKLIEAMITGTPSVTTKVGMEGIVSSHDTWNGVVADDNELFANSAIELYTNQTMWEDASKRSLNILKERFDKNEHNKLFMERVNNLKNNLDKSRSNNLMGSILNYNSNRSTKFFSMWIEAKNK